MVGGQEGANETLDFVVCYFGQGFFCSWIFCITNLYYQFDKFLFIELAIIYSCWRWLNYIFYNLCWNHNIIINEKLITEQI